MPNVVLEFSLFTELLASRTLIFEDGFSSSRMQDVF